MNENDFNEALGELVTSENLSAFSVVDRFCNDCGDLTPHHVDESKAHESELRIDSEIEEEQVMVAPISSLECVICRENEENCLDDLY
ncbi:hypothetical protein A9Q84_10850 [Halobacteriovorax marinus]|uniref:Uncharacterized protein n=1 Tax=Halobacteriovorax marinus TaxID=97084 RepID=A0A1Y5F7D9_9BACT|nr:hypothetical protein A9Q84_10850 [Halobacteriovorax marinus]